MLRLSNADFGRDPEQGPTLRERDRIGDDAAQMEAIHDYTGSAARCRRADRNTALWSMLAGAVAGMMMATAFYWWWLG